MVSVLLFFNDSKINFSRFSLFSIFITQIELVLSLGLITHGNHISSTQTIESFNHFATTNLGVLIPLSENIFIR